MTALENQLISIRRRMTLRRNLLIYQVTFWGAAFIGLIIQIIGRIFPIDNLDWLTFLPFILWLIMTGIWLALKPLSLMEAARAIDQELELKERISTALVFQNKISEENEDSVSPGEPTSGTREISTENQNSLRESLIQRQYNDALIRAKSIQLQKEIPLHWKPRHLFAAASLIVLTIILLVVPNPMDAILAQKAAIRAEAIEQAEKIEIFQENIKESAALSPEAEQELIQHLKDLSEELRNNSGDQEKAIQDLARFEENLMKKLDPNLSTKEALLSALSDRLDQNLNARESNSSSQDKLEELTAQLSQEIDKMDEQEREILSRTLAQMSALANQTGEISFGQALMDLAQAIQSSDPAKVGEAVREFQGELTALEQKISEQKALQQAIAQSESSRQALSQAGRSVASGQNGTSNPGANAGTGRGSQPGPGGGANVNQLPPATGGRTNVRPRGNAQETALGELDTSIYSPWQRSASEANELFIPGQETGEGELSAREGQSQQPGISNPSIIPYNQVFLQYLTTANQAMQQDFIPGNLKEYIRLYFSNLETVQ